MKKRSVVLSVALITLTAAVELISPALAATKLIDFRQRNLTFGPFLTALVICGSTVTSFTVHIRELSSVLWDNGHLEVTFKDTNIWFDSGGARIAQAQIESITVRGEGGFPFTHEFNMIVTCSGASATPGLDFQMIFGFTIGEDGMPKEFHAHT